MSDNLEVKKQVNANPIPAPQQVLEENDDLLLFGEMDIPQEQDTAVVKEEKEEAKRQEELEKQRKREEKAELERQKAKKKAEWEKYLEQKKINDEVSDEISKVRTYALDTMAKKSIGVTITAKTKLAEGFKATFTSKVSDASRAKKQNNKRSRLFQKRKNIETIVSQEEKVREDLANKMDKLYGDRQEELGDDYANVAAFMGSDEFLLEKIVDNLSDGRNTTVAIDHMWTALNRTGLENVHLENDKELAKNAQKLETLSMRVSAFESMADKYNYACNEMVTAKLEQLKSIVRYYDTRKEVIMDPYYMSHYNEELSMDFTSVDENDPEAAMKIRVAKKLAKAYEAGRDMVYKNTMPTELLAKWNELNNTNLSYMLSQKPVEGGEKMPEGDYTNSSTFNNTLYSKKMLIDDFNKTLKDFERIAKEKKYFKKIDKNIESAVKEKLNLFNAIVRRTEGLTAFKELQADKYYQSHQDPDHYVGVEKEKIPESILNIEDDDERAEEINSWEKTKETRIRIEELLKEQKKVETQVPDLGIWKTHFYETDRNSEAELIQKYQLTGGRKIEFDAEIKDVSLRVFSSRMAKLYPFRYLANLSDEEFEDIANDIMMKKTYGQAWDDYISDIKTIWDYYKAKPFKLPVDEKPEPKVVQKTVEDEYAHYNDKAIGEEYGWVLDAEMKTTGNTFAVPVSGYIAALSDLYDFNDHEYVKQYEKSNGKIDTVKLAEMLTKQGIKIADEDEYSQKPEPEQIEELKNHVKAMEFVFGYLNSLDINELKLHAGSPDKVNKDRVRILSLLAGEAKKMMNNYGELKDEIREIYPHVDEEEMISDKWWNDNISSSLSEDDMDELADKIDAIIEIGKEMKKSEKGA